MTKQRAIIMLKQLNKFKENSIMSLNEKKFTTDLEDIRSGLVSILQSDIEILGFVLEELQTNNVNKKKL